MSYGFSFFFALQATFKFQPQGHAENNIDMQYEPSSLLMYESEFLICVMEELTE